MQLFGGRADLYLDFMGVVIFLIPEDFFEPVHQSLNLAVALWVLDASHGLVHTQVRDDITDESLDGGQLPAVRRGKRQLVLWNINFAGRRSHDLSVEVGALEDARSVDSSFS
jgi:hypothetical protein